MMTNNSSDIPSLKLSTVEELQAAAWSLESALSVINSNYHSFERDITWSHYGEVMQLVKSLSDLRSNIDTLLKKMDIRSK